MLAQILYDAFASTHRRIGLIFLDVLWKAIWAVVTAVLLGVVIFSIASKMQALNSERNFQFPGTAPLLVLTFLRQWWEVYGNDALWSGGGVIAISLTLWLILEAYFRSVLLPVTDGERLETTAAGKRATKFPVFLATGIARNLILFATAFLMGGITFAPYLGRPIGEWPALWEDTRGVTAIGLAILFAIGFFLTIADTLIRSDAVLLLASHMLEIIGLVGSLFLFEACIVASAGTAVILVAVHVSTPSQFVASMCLGVMTILLISFIHSYLLVVRYFSIDIMRCNVDV